MNLAIFLFISLILVSIQTAIPYLVKRNIVFGVTVPEQHLKMNKIKAFKKSYSILVFLLSFTGLASYAIWALNTKPSEEQIVLVGTLIQFGIIIFSISLYFYFHGKTQQLKRSQNWMENLKQIKVADLAVRAKDEMLPWYVYLLPILISLGMIGYTIMNYHLLPDQIPTHWGITGEADAFTDKTPISAVSSLLVLLVLQIMFLMIHWGMKKSGIKISASSVKASSTRQLALRKYTSWLFFIISFLMSGQFSILHLKTLHPELLTGKIMMAMPIVFLIVVLIGTIVFAVKIGGSDKQTYEVIEGGITDYDDDAYWKGGLFYFNKKDPSIFVEKRFGVGWTINFANPIAYLIIVLPIIILVVLAFVYNF